MINTSKLSYSYSKLPPQFKPLNDLSFTKDLSVVGRQTRLKVHKKRLIDGRVPTFYNFYYRKRSPKLAVFLLRRKKIYNLRHIRSAMETHALYKFSKYY